MARWWSLHEDLHAATQACAELASKMHVATLVPAQLVGLGQLHVNGGGSLVSMGLAVTLRAPLARASSGGPARVLPRGPARVLPWRTVVPGNGLAGGLVAFLGKDLAEDHRLLILV